MDRPIKTLVGLVCVWGRGGSIWEIIIIINRIFIHLSLLIKLILKCTTFDLFKCHISFLDSYIDIVLFLTISQTSSLVRDPSSPARAKHAHKRTFVTTFTLIFGCFVYLDAICLNYVSWLHHSLVYVLLTILFLYTYVIKGFHMWSYSCHNI